VLHESPLDAHAAAPRHLVEGPTAHYDLAFEVRGAPPESDDAVYDRQDVFFMPLSRFSSIERPGPTIRVYRRRNATSPPSATD
jgi:hypothetical protein